MTVIPDSVSEPAVPGIDDTLELVQRGKVRDIYRVSETLLLIVTTDRINIFDFVLPTFVPGKGEVLNALNIHWRRMLGNDILPTDLVAYGEGIDAYLPRNLARNLQLQRRAIIVDALTMLPVELIVRGCLTESSLESYQRDGTMSGHTLPPGLADGDQLPEPLFTSTPKAHEGHNAQMEYQKVERRFGSAPREAAIELYKRGAAIAADNRVIIADTKFELGTSLDGTLTLGGDVLTPESSRFWDADEYAAARGNARSTAWQDNKQYVRDWGKRNEIHKLDPNSQRHHDHVHGLAVPEDVIAKTKEVYETIAHRLLGTPIGLFQTEKMHLTPLM